MQRLKSYMPQTIRRVIEKEFFCFECNKQLQKMRQGLNEVQNEYENKTA